MRYVFPKHVKHIFLTTSLLVGISAHLQADVIEGNDLNSNAGKNETINSFYSENRGTNGGGDQSLQFGDVLYGTYEDDVIIGGLGIDVLFGENGDDILIGGTEDFNPHNRDRAFGGEGDDIFIWAPGDGNDFFDGGEDTDVLVMGLIGENKDADGNEENAPYFQVSTNQDFDGIYLNEAYSPVMDLQNSPGFCEIVEKDAEHSADLLTLDIDHLIRFVLRGKRSAFLDSLETDTPLTDDGLRIAVHLKNVEFLVCGGVEDASVKIFDLTTIPATEVDFSQLPLVAQTLLNDNFRAVSAR